MGCTAAFEDPKQWVTHCTAHFKRQPLPKIAKCVYCDDWSIDRHDDAWLLKLLHVLKHHQNGDAMAKESADMPLIHHLWQKKLLDPTQYKDLLNHKCLEPRAEAFGRTHSSRHERRRGRGNL